MTVTVTISGEGIEFEREITENTAVQLMQLTINNGAAGNGTSEEALTDTAATEPTDADDEHTAPTDASDDTDADQQEPEALPSNFFRRLSTKQEAMIKVLLDADGQLTSSELRQQMEEDHGVETGGGRALAGIIAGLTRKYGNDFELIDVQWGDDQGLYQLNPDYPQYIEEIEDYFGEQQED
ncbi:hypothetical protein [Halorarum salinum]|uniref:Uncharacterized protein n=1 Tax=Halorarum salinum TaxID=2743089 RepID=A0A7D5LAR2_9EURY|nr:hypothetical protein [Halobaculum salinum]QLG62030.1 hypothetical protein HUG12_09955 [Halobaculum salinum]